MAITEFLISKITDYLESRTFYVGLHISDPALATNPSATELTSLVYQRGSATFQPTASGLGVWNDAAIRITGLPAGTVTHAGVWTQSDPAVSATLVFSAELSDAPFTLKPAGAVGQTYQLDAHDLVISFD